MINGYVRLNLKMIALKKNKCTQYKSHHPYVFIAVWTKLISSNYGTLHEHSTIFYNYSLHILISENMPLKNPRWNLGKPLLSLLLLLFSYYACFLTSSPLHDGLMIIRKFRIDPAGYNPKSGSKMKKYLFRIDPGWYTTTNPKY